MRRAGFAVVLTALVAMIGFAQPAKVSPQGLRVESIGTPVKSARYWTTGLSPNPRGGYNFITQIYNVDKSGKMDTDWVVLDLASGQPAKRFTFPGYANSNFQIENQLRAANGRIFFAIQGTRFCYYDPETETIGMIGPLFPATPGGPGFFYQNQIGPDGLLYSTTQSSDGFTYLAVVNPDTLTFKTFEKIGGKVRKEMLTYGYWIEVDPPWVYVCVGQETWALVAVNTETSESKVLAEVPAPYRISFNSREHVRVSITSEYTGTDMGEGTFKDNVLYVPSQKVKTEYFWLAADKMIPAMQNYNAAELPFTPRSMKKFPPLELTKTKALPLGTPPELDLSGLGLVVDNSFTVKWRPAGSPTAAEWRTASFPLKNVIGIKIQSLIALKDGTLLGNAEQYNGFFRYKPADNKLAYYGKAGPSQPVIAEADGKVYFTGYPNSVLYVYDPAKPWTCPFPADFAAISKAELNPHVLGQFAVKTGTHYAYGLVAEGGRLYMYGRRERQGQGGGVGYYDIASGKFEGTNANLNFLVPRGFAVMPALKKIVYSGELIDDPTHPTEKPAEAQLVVYDMEMKELKRITVKPGLASTGWLYVAPSGKQIVGVLNTPTDKAIYLFDMETEKLVKWVTLTDAIDWVSTNPKDGKWFGRVKSTLVQLDPATLDVKPIGDLGRALAYPVWQAGVLYGTDGPELFKVTLP